QRLRVVGARLLFHQGGGRPPLVRARRPRRGVWRVAAGSRAGPVVDGAASAHSWIRFTARTTLAPRGAWQVCRASCPFSPYVTPFCFLAWWCRSLSTARLRNAQSRPV